LLIDSVSRWETNVVLLHTVNHTFKTWLRTAEETQLRTDWG